MYLEKLFLAKLYRDDQKSLDKLGLKQNCAEDKTANQKCKVKIRAVGLNYKEITTWLEQPQQKEAILKIMLIDQNKKSLTEQDLNDLRKFVSEFRRLLVETKTDKQLIRMINENLQAFGPHSTGSNLLINKYIPKQDSLLHKIDTVLGAGEEEEKKETAHSQKKAAEM